MIKNLINMMHPVFSLEETLQDKTIGQWPSMLGISQSDYFSSLSDHFNEKDRKQLHDSNIHFTGEVLMWAKSYYHHLDSSNRELFNAVNTVKEKFFVSDAIAQLYTEKSKNFRKQYLVDHFNDLTVVANVAKHLEVSFFPTNKTLIGDNDYRKLHFFRSEPDKTKVATMYRKYHLLHFLEENVFLTL